MKLLKIIPITLTILTINIIDAKAAKGTKPTPAPSTTPRTVIERRAPVRPTPPSRRPRPVTPAAPSVTPAAGKTFMQLYVQVKKMQAGNVINPQTQLLSDSFIADMVEEIKNAGLGELELTRLLLLARDLFVPFTGNDVNDLNLLQNINNQIENATTKLGTE